MKLSHTFPPLTSENQTVDVAMLSGPRCYQHVLNVLESDNTDNKQLSGSTSDPVLLHCGRKSKYLRTRDLSKICRSAPILHHFIIIIQPRTHCPSNLTLLVYNVTFHITSIIIISTLWKVNLSKNEIMACVCAHVNYALTHAGVMALKSKHSGFTGRTMWENYSVQLFHISWQFNSLCYFNIVLHFIQNDSRLNLQ